MIYPICLMQYIWYTLINFHQYIYIYMDELVWVLSARWYDEYGGSSLDDWDTVVGTLHGAAEFAMKPIIYPIIYFYIF